MSDSKIPEDGVSRKLKISVYILTGVTLFAFVAFFTKLITKERIQNKQEKKLKSPRIMELKKAGVSMVLYPLSAFRAMSKAAERIYKEIINKGSQENVIGSMQTREELYEHLSYYKYENEMDEIIKGRK